MSEQLNKDAAYYGMVAKKMRQPLGAMVAYDESGNEILRINNPQCVGYYKAKEIMYERQLMYQQLEAETLKQIEG